MKGKEFIAMTTRGTREERDGAHLAAKSLGISIAAVLRIGLSILSDPFVFEHLAQLAELSHSDIPTVVKLVITRRLSEAHAEAELDKKLGLEVWPELLATDLDEIGPLARRHDYWKLEIQRHRRRVKVADYRHMRERVDGSETA